ncbi:DUF4097 family beta strand repeat-containing protein [Dictyobacter alpinus]|nr:DUF4097 family beta strand repeat-containing protein [Dictyobacter alpinus]
MIPNIKVLVAMAVAGLSVVIVIVGIGVYLYYITPSNGLVGSAKTTPSVPANASVTTVPANATVQNTTHNPSGPASQQFQVGAHPVLTVKGHKGDINVHAGSAGTINVAVYKHGTHQAPDPKVVRVLYDQATDAQGRKHITVSSELASKEIDYDISVPATTEAEVTVDAGTISVRGIAAIAIDAGSGSLALDDIHGPVNVRTDSGDITAKHIVGAMTMEGSSGSIRADDVHGSLKATTTSGDVVAGDAVLNGQSILETMSGSVSFSGSMAASGSYQLETQSGDIDLTLPENAAFELHPNINVGSINNEFGGEQVGRMPRAQITVNIVSGSLNLNKGD